jgi:hypothetical protein
LVALPYLTYADWQWQIWISLVEYGPLYALLSLPLLQAVAKRIRAAGPRLGERQVDPGMSR